MAEIKRKSRPLPDYSRGEEIFNMASHIVGAAFGIIVLIFCTVLSVQRRDPWALGSSIVYGISLIVLYTISSVYHGLHVCSGKRVMRVLDHCAIYFLISGTYTPYALCALRGASAGWAWTIFGLVWGLAAMATVFTAIDMKRFSKLSMCCYVGMGWCILLAAKPLIAVMEPAGIAWLLAGGLAYTFGAVLYGIGKRRRYVHSVFHLFVLAGSLMQFVSIYFYVL